MDITKRLNAYPHVFVPAGLILAWVVPNLFSQQSTTAQPDAAKAKEAAAQATARDHQNMMDQLGIKALRPGSQRHGDRAESRQL